MIRVPSVARSSVCRQYLPVLYSVAVGTPVARRPPHGSVREELPHTALTLGLTISR